MLCSLPPAETLTALIAALDDEPKPPGDQTVQRYKISIRFTQTDCTVQRWRRGDGKHLEGERPRYWRSKWLSKVIRKQRETSAKGKERKRQKNQLCTFVRRVNISLMWTIARSVATSRCNILLISGVSHAESLSQSQTVRSRGTLAVVTHSKAVPGSIPRPGAFLLVEFAASTFLSACVLSEFYGFLT